MVSHGFNSVQHSTYSLTKDDQLVYPLNYDCPVEANLLEVWTYSYFAYKRS